MTITIDADFDGGNIEVLDASDARDIRLAIRPDRFSPYFQWFAFRIVGARGVTCRLRIVNAGAASYEPGWRNGYRAAVLQAPAAAAARIRAAFVTRKSSPTTRQRAPTARVKATMPAVSVSATGSSMATMR